MPSELEALPSTGALRTFEAAARHLSFTAAALELGRTQGAVSHQMRELESRLGVSLFEREARGIALTVGVDGSIWIRGVDDVDSVQWMVLNSDGGSAFSVRLPVKLRVRAATSNAVWGTTTDELDVPYIVRLTIPEVM